MRRWVWICGVTTSNVVTLVLQGTQSRLTWQNTPFKTLNFVTKVFMMRHLLMSNCLFGMCCRAWICGVTTKNVVSLVLQGAPSDKLFFTSYILQAPLVNSLCFLQFRVDENFDSLPHEDLPTIDMETMATLRDEEVESTVPPAPATRESSLMPATPTSATTRQVPTAETPVGEEVIRTCVTPRRVRGVQLALRKENEQHRCAVKLLPYFFTDEELISSNTDGSHGKLPLDSNKLNS